MCVVRRSAIAARNMLRDMLHEFLSANRETLIDRCRRKVALRSGPYTQIPDLPYGIPLFLDQLVRALRMEQTRERSLGSSVLRPSWGDSVASSGVGNAAMHYGSELGQRGYTIDQVVHHYGDLCQAVTDLAIEHAIDIEVDEFRALNRCLDDAIADAVTGFSYERESVMAGKAGQSFNERLGSLAHDLRNHVHTAGLALEAVRAGTVGVHGATGAILGHCLARLRTLIDRSLADVRLTAGMAPRQERFAVSGFISDVASSAALEAMARDCELHVLPVDPVLAVDADRDLLFCALGNILQNAFKFTRPRTGVSLKAYAVTDSVLIDVADHCGGLPPGDAERLFLPFTQGGADRKGMGLGLSISRRTVEANGGTLSVRDLPGTGCIFTIALPAAECASAL